MRRPPDKEGQSALSERDVESSNATLNALFGGSRQKSWMVGAGTPVRPTPRSNVPKSSAPPTTLARQSAASVLPSPAPSDEASPTLVPSTINRTRNESQQETLDGNTTAAPPPATPFIANQQTTSEPATEYATESAPESMRINQLLGSFSRPSSSSSRVQSPGHSRRQSLNAPSVTEPSATIMENPPLPSSVLLPSERQQNRHISQDTYSPSQESAVSPVQLGTPTSQHRTLPSPRMSSLSGLGMTTWPTTMQQQTSSVGATQEGLHVPGDTTQSENSGQNNTSSTARIGEVRSPIPTQPNMVYHSPSTSTMSNPNKRQRTQAPAMPSLKGRISLIEKHIASVGGIQNLNTGLERPRFQLLTDACRNEDPFYVALHQVFCVWDVNRQEVINIPGYPNSNTLQAAFKILGNLIRDNDQLAPAHKIWFAQFPSPLSQLLLTSEPYRQNIADVGVFLERLTVDWVSLSAEWTQRGYPPLVDELVSRWGLLSPTLQSVVFTATRRNLGIRDEDLGTRMEDLFRRDQREHQELSSRVNTARPPTAKEVQERNMALVNEYVTLHNHIIQRRSSTATSGSPLVNGPTPVLPSNSLRPQSNSIPHPIAWQSNMPSPDPVGNWQPAAQNHPSGFRSSNTSPNPANIAGRPPSVGSHRISPDTPSPTSLQGLSMNSPAQQGFQFTGTARNVPPIQSNTQYPQGYSGPNVNGQGHIDPNNYNRNMSAVQHQQQYPPQYFSPHQPTYQAQQYQPAQGVWPSHAVQINQHQALMRQQQRQREQQAVIMNRAAQLRNDSVDSQRAHARNSSVGSTTSTGRRTPTGRPSTRVVGTPASAPVRPMANEHALHAYINKPPMQRSIVPPLGFTHAAFPAIPDQVALHQAHLRSPRLVAAGNSPRDMPIDSSSLRYYQAIRDFALPPTRISISTPLSKFDFRPSAAEFAMIPEDMLHSNGQITDRQYQRGTLQYRLRCVQAKQTATKCPIVDWVLKDTIWPEGTSLSINKKHLEIRRKSHHGKDLPIDITPYVRLPGPNMNSQIALSILRGRTKMKEHSYFIGVEVIEILQHDQILDMVRKNRISAASSLDKIKRSLAGPADEDDDDIAMVVSDLSIDLADPFTARIFDTPVRGISCLHRECFDLETFLLTRNSKPKRKGQPCMIDVWKCPLCGKDARPYSLQIDDFLVSVRQTLEVQGNLDAKAIWVGGDGNWRPKIEKRKAPPDPNDSDDSDDQVPRNPSVSLHQAGEIRQNRVVEVIEIDDD